jgi:hypothetical protein
MPTVPGFVQEGGIIAALRDFIAVTSKPPSFLHKFLHTDSDFQSRNIEDPSDAPDKDSCFY